jgi:hypothetical protein
MHDEIMSYYKKPHAKLQNKKQKHMPGKTVELLSFINAQVHKIREGPRKAAGRTIATRTHFNETADGMRIGIKKIGIAQHYSY